MAVVVFPRSLTEDALTFGSTTGSRVAGVADALDDMTRVTIAILVRPTTFTDNRAIVSKGTTTTGWALSLSGTGGNVKFVWQNVVTDTTYTSTSTPLKLNNWTWLMVTADTSLGVGLKIAMWSAPFGGSGPPSAVTLTATAEGVGLNSSDAPDNFSIGNLGTTLAFQGDISLVALSRGALFTQAEFAQLLRSTNFWPTRARGLWALGGTGPQGSVFDLSGNRLALNPTAVKCASSAPTLGVTSTFRWRALGKLGTIYTQGLSASITASATVSRSTKRALSASATASGVVSRNVSRALSASSTLTGTVTKLTSRALAASSAPSAALTGIKTSLKSLAASLTPSATVTKLTARALSAASTATGAVSRAVFRALGASMTGSATVSKQTARSLAASGTPSATITKRTGKALSASLTPTATVAAAGRVGCEGRQFNLSAEEPGASFVAGRECWTGERWLRKHAQCSRNSEWM